MPFVDGRSISSIWCNAANEYESSSYVLRMTFKTAHGVECKDVAVAVRLEEHWTDGAMMLLSRGSCTKPQAYFYLESIYQQDPANLFRLCNFIGKQASKEIPMRLSHTTTASHRMSYLTDCSLIGKRASNEAKIISVTQYSLTMGLVDGKQCTGLIVNVTQLLDPTKELQYSIDNLSACSLPSDFAAGDRDRSH